MLGGCGPLSRRSLQCPLCTLATTRMSRLQQGPNILPSPNEGEEVDALLGARTPRDTPLPKLQLALLCALRMLDPLAFSQIFPYINSFIEKLHLTDDPSQIGFYSGLVESAFAISQLLAIYPWAWASDIIGRRPVIIAGTLGLSLTTILFGLSSNFTAIMISRSLAGLFTGNVAVIPSVLCEITDYSNQVSAFPIFGLFWPLGSTIGPLIGGSLSNPADKFPEWFDKPLFRRYPYFLPCFMAAMACLMIAVASYMFLQESIPKKYSAARGASHHCNYGTLHDGLHDTGKPLTASDLLTLPVIRALCASGFILSFITTAFDVVFVLFCYTSVQSGGLGFSESQIGYSLALSGVLAASLQLFLMPTLLRRCHHIKLYIASLAMWPFTFMAFPIIGILARNIHAKAEDNATSCATSSLWFGIIIALAMARCGFLGHSLNMILVKRHAPPNALASTNGLVQFCVCFSRAFSPAIASSLFALSTDNGWSHGYLWVLVMMFICCSGTIVSWRMFEVAKFTN